MPTSAEIQIQNELLKTHKSLLSDINDQLSESDEGFADRTRAQKIMLSNYRSILNSSKDDNATNKLGNKQFAERLRVVGLILDDNKSIKDLNKVIATKTKDINRLKKIGHDFIADEVQNTVDLLSQERDRLEKGEALNALQSEFGSLTGGIMGSLDQIKSKGALAFAIGSAFTILKLFSDTLDDIGAKFGTIGVTEFSRELGFAGAKANKLGFGLSDAMDSAEVLSSEFGIAFDSAIGMTQEVANISRILGMSVSEGAKLVGVLTTTMGLSIEQSTSMAQQVELLSKQHKVAPTAVMKDIAESAETIAKFTSAGTDNITKAAIQAKKLGTTLDVTAQIAEGLLDFESSIQSEIQASLLIGRRLNFQKARELALNNDIAGAMGEVVSQLGSESEFNALNVIQRKALAESIGVGVDVLAKFVRHQKKSLTLTESLANKKGFSEIMGEDAISNLTELIFQFKSLGATLVQTLGPALNIIVGVVGSLVKLIDKFIGLAPLAITLTGLWAVNTARLAIAQLFAKGALLGIAGIAAAVIGTSLVIKAMSSVPKLADGGVVMPRAGGTIVRVGEAGSPEAIVPLNKAGIGTTSSNDTLALKRDISAYKMELIGLRSDLKKYFGTGGSAINGIGKSVSKNIENIATV